MLTLLKLTILGILFIISGGMFFSQHFREHKLLIFSAAIVATLGSIYLFRDVCEDVEICAEFMDESSNGNGEQLSESKGNNKPIEKPEVSVVPEESSFEPKKDLKVKIDVEKLESDAKKSDFSGYFKPQKGMFETTANFQARREELLKLFNYQVGNRNLAYQVGTVHLEKYDADNQVFAVNLDWQANWLKPFFSDFSFEKAGSVKIGIDAAEQIYKEGKKKSLFVTAELVGNTINIQPVMVEKGAIYLTSVIPPEPHGKVFQERLKDGGLAPKIVKIPAGRFRMGDIQGGGASDEKPVRSVEVKAFAMGQYEVTFEEYDKFCESTGRSKPSDSGWGRGNRPVINVSWNDAVAYTEWLSEQTGQNYRLPTEAEWEYAARAGSETKYWWGNDADEACNYGNVHDNTSKRENGFSWTHHECNDGYAQTSPVGNFKANGFGLYDTVGNVWEWTCSAYESYGNGEEQRCADKNANKNRVLRGGAWGDKPSDTRSAGRDILSQDVTDSYVGFRVARTLAP